MGTNSRWRIAIETERILIVARRHVRRGWCERCGHEVELLTEESAARLFGIRPDRVTGQSRSRFHLQHAKEGFVICLKSLVSLLRSAGIESDLNDLPRGGTRR
jgi:hypothetical protein